jgi:hypothetical protein
LVFLVKPTDTDCLNDQEKTTIQPAGIVDVQRLKNATVILHPPANCMKAGVVLILIDFLFR